MSDKVYILDEIVTKPGMVAAYRDAYLAGYAPGARKRGMTLEYVRLTPPFELKEGSNTLHFLWSVESVPAWWGMRLGSTAEHPADQLLVLEENAWWEKSKDMAISRRRSVMIDYAGAKGGA